MINLFYVVAPETASYHGAVGRYFFTHNVSELLTSQEADRLMVFIGGEKKQVSINLTLEELALVGQYASHVKDLLTLLIDNEVPPDENADVLDFTKPITSRYETDALKKNAATTADFHRKRNQQETPEPLIPGTEPEPDAPQHDAQVRAAIQIKRRNKKEVPDQPIGDIAVRMAAARDQQAGTGREAAGRPDAAPVINDLAERMGDARDRSEAIRNRMTAGANRQVVKLPEKGDIIVPLDATLFVAEQNGVEIPGYNTMRAAIAAADREDTLSFDSREHLGGRRDKASVTAAYLALQLHKNELLTEA